MTDTCTGRTARRIPSEELEEIPMGDYNTRIGNRVSAHEYSRQLDRENCFGSMIRHRLAIVVSVLFAATVLAFVAIATYLATAPADAKYTEIDIKKITEVNVDPAVSEEPAVDELENKLGDRNLVFSLRDEPSDDMLDTLIKDTWEIVPAAAYQAGRMKRMRREVEEITSVESCRERHDNCKALLNKVKKMTKNVSHQVYQLQKMINRLGIMNEELPSLQNVTALDFATCLRCEKLENQTAGLNVTETLISDSISTHISTNHSKTEYNQTVTNDTTPVVLAETSSGSTEATLLPTAVYPEGIANITQSNKTDYSVNEFHAINGTDFFFRHSLVNANSASKFEQVQPSNEPEVLWADSSTAYVTEAVLTTEDGLAATTTSKPDNDGQPILTSSYVDQSHSSQGKANAEVNQFVIPTAETSKGSLQVTYTPNVNWMPYPLCVYGPPNPPPQSPFMQPGSQQGVQFLPTQFQQPSVPVLPQRYGPTGPGMQYFPVNQAYHQPTGTGQARPVYCAYLPTPTFQFPMVPGVSEFQRAVPDSGSSPVEPDEFYKQEFKSRDYATGCPPDTRPCSDSGRCIPRSRWCDGEVDCHDASDETRCSCRDRVDRERLCDGYFDCPLGEDELGCFGCDRDSFSCGGSEDRRRWGNCVPLGQRCDGYPDCPNGIDEMNCNIITHSVEDRELFTVGYTTGYLHRNWRGKWYPACTAAGTWANDACRDEIGDVNYRDFPVVETVDLRQNYNGPFVSQISFNEIQVVPSCSGKAVFVSCPKMPCGTSLPSRDNVSLFDIPYHDRFPSGGLPQVISNVLDTFGFKESNSKNETEATSVNNETPQASNTTDKNNPILGEVRVVGGRPSQPRAWPALVTVNRDGNFHCGGVILDDQWVLTAAHCVDGYRQHYFDIQSGILRRFSYSPMEQSRKVIRVVMYPSYDRAVMKNDIALLRLETPLNFNRWVRPACLPDTTTAGPYWRSGPPPATTCISAGWGSTVEHGPDPDHLREVDLPILPNCKHLVDRNDAEICAGRPQGGRDTCQGDSGGPLMCRNPDSPLQWYVAGIVSHGEGCARPNEPGAYTKVSRFVGWIDNVRARRDLPEERPLQRCPGYHCHSGSGRCYSAKRRCDKSVDCIDAEDEINCRRRADYRDRDLLSGKARDASGDVDENTTEGETSSSTSILESTTIQTTEAHEELNTTMNPVEVSTTVTTSTMIQPVEQTTQQITTVKPHEDSITVATDLDIITPPSPPPRHFTCRILLQTIDLSKRCDREVNCEDGTDEENCSCKDYLAKISPASICDGHIDCHDGTDEENCEICSPGEFQCKRSRECVPIEKRCNVKGDCEYNEDELGCLTLTDGKYVDIDIDGMPHHKIEGILTSYENGKWVPFCLDRRPNRPATLGKQMCSYFGFAGCESFNETRLHVAPLEVRASSATDLTPYEYSPRYSLETEEEPRCTALYLRCLPTIHTVPLAYRVKGIDGQDDTFLWPWHAAVFVDGRYKCSAVLLEPSWLLTSAYCTDDVDLNQNYTTALLGVSRSYLQVDGPHQQISQVDEIKIVKDSDAVLLHLKYPTNMTRHVQPMYLQKRTHAPAESDTCATVGVDSQETTRTVFLKAVLHNCPDNHRCYQNTKPEKCGNNTMLPWSGVVVCFGCSGWYPAAVYHEETGLCSFSKKQSSSSIDYINTNLITGLQEAVKPSLQEPMCRGFRCPLGECIPSNKVCDGIPHCRDGADESAEYCQEIRDHCANGVDETFGKCHCAQSELRCASGQCVPKSSFCDGNIDCVDGTDEPLNCTCAAYLQLTAKEKICDGRRNCLDKSDENPEVCYCRDSSFKCDRNADECVSQDFVCDGEPDCSSGEDERHCQTLMAHPSDPPGYGEIIKRSSGVWHSECFPAGALSDNKLRMDILCIDFGYSYAKNFTESDSNGPRNSPLVPMLDKFYMVRLNQRTWIVMRDDTAFVSLHPPLETCYRHYVTCA